MKIVLMLMVVLMWVGTVQAQDDVQLAFTLNPDGQLQASALAGTPRGGDIQVWVEGQHIANISMPDMETGDVIVLAIVPNPMQVTTWEIRGAYHYVWVWENDGMYLPDLDLPTDQPPDVLSPAPMPALHAPTQPFIRQFIAIAGQKQRG